MHPDIAHVLFMDIAGFSKRLIRDDPNLKKLLSNPEPATVYK